MMRDQGPETRDQRLESKAFYSWSLVTCLVSLVFILSLVFIFPAWGAKENPLRVTPVVKIVKKESPSVVNISTEQVVLVKKPSPFWPDPTSTQQNFLPGVQTVKLPSLGSGVIVDKEGLILTNAHVVAHASTIYVIFSDGRKVIGKLIGLNPTHDLAVIKIDPPFPLKVVEMAIPDDILIGEPVIALGNPYGLSSSISTGVISAIHRDLFTPQGQLVFKDLIQTDTAINPGSSGGALLNMEGKLIGINQIVAQQAQGIGFAIPIKTIKPLLEEFRKNYELQLAAAKKLNSPALPST